MVKFLHFSDTHLGNRQYMMDEREQDFYDAFNEAIELGLSEHVDFFVHSGDLFDNWSPSNHALSEFKDAAMKLDKHEKKMFLIMGDHDRPKRSDYPAAKIFDFLGIRLMGLEEVEHTTIALDGEEVLISGISNMKGLRRQNLKNEYEKADLKAKEYKSSILLSHQGVTGYLIDEACEAKYSDLPKMYSYLGFGHVHNRALRTDTMPVFSYAGSTELNSTNELEEFLRKKKGVNLVEVNSGEVKVEQLNLENVRFQEEISANYSNYIDKIKEVEQKFGDRFDELRKALITIKINGDADKDDVRRTLSEYSNRILFRPPIFISEKVSMEAKPTMNNLIDYFKAYFKDDSMAELANQIYDTLRNEDDHSVKEIILKKMGIVEETEGSG